MSEAQTWTAPPMGTPCWIEIPAVDVQACKKFYSALFPSWSFKPATENYPDEKIAMWSFAGPTGLTGGITRIPASCRTGEHPMGVGTTIYHFVDSIEETKKKVEELGGKAIGEKEPEGENGYYIYCKDVEGNRFGLYELKKK